MEATLLVLGAYLVGSIPMAYIVGRLAKGIDLRRYGSGTLGGANVWVHVGKWAVLPAGGFDFLVKGAGSIALGKYVLDLGTLALAAAGLAAIAGHNWSPYLKFSGGRGVGAALGVLAVLAWKEMAVLIVLGLFGKIVLRDFGLWVGIGIAVLAPASVLFGEPFGVTAFCLGFLALTVAKRLAAGSLPGGVPRQQVLLNRLLYDRDVAGQDEWVSRTPEEEQAGS